MGALIERIKLMLDYEVSDGTIETYINIANEAILNRLYPYHDITELPARYENKCVEIAVYLLNKRGAEGETSHTENGITRMYENANIPKSMLSDITPRVGII